MEKIKRFFECLVPVTACNLKCDYCYIIQRKQRTMSIPKLKYSVEHIGYALRKERMGGVCYFSICGAGETLLADQIVQIVEALLKEGHYVNITTNGTITNRIDELLRIKSELLTHLHISFSFHYLELKRLGLLDTFFDNIHKVHSAGCSYLVQLNLYDKYIPYLKEINELCVDEVGAPPQIVPTRDEVVLSKDIRLYTKHTQNEYCDYAKTFKSPLFDFNIKNFNIKHKEFCYAGDWSAVLNLQTGVMNKCYFYGLGHNIFDNPNEKINFSAVGKCGGVYCMNSSHFLAWGAIPSLYKDVSYGMLRNREQANWENEPMKYFLNTKLSESNKQYSIIKRNICYYKTSTYLLLRKVKSCLMKIFKK